MAGWPLQRTGEAPTAGELRILTAAWLIGVWLFRKAAAQLVFGVSPADPTTFLTSAVVLIDLAVAACLIPARRAIRIDPMMALRYE